MGLFDSKKIAKLEEINQSLLKKTHQLSVENEQMQNSLTRLDASFQLYTGENTINELGTLKELIIDYEALRLRSWEMLIKNHIAALMVNKRINWHIGSGLLFNARPSEKPFVEYYGSKELGLEMQKKFVTDAEYLFRNYAKTLLSDYSKQKNLHELARHADYNASGDGDVLILMRVKNGFPNIQVISGGCVLNPVITDKQIVPGNYVNEGVEFNESGEVIAYHVDITQSESNGTYRPIPDTLDYGTKRIPAYFPGTKIRSAWLYKQSDFSKAGETRTMPFISHLFETLKHLNDYLIANSKNAQLLSQIAFAFEREAYTTNERIFGEEDLSSLGMTTDDLADTCATDTEVKLAANAAEFRLNGNGIVMDLPKGVKAKILNPEAQSNQTEYLKSTLQTLSATVGQPLEVLLSSYNSNYSASMGARSDFQFTLDVLTELIPANQLYRKVYNMFIYLMVYSGKIECPPLLEAYNSNDLITIQAIINSSFEGTKLKPIDPVKFINSLRAQIPEKYRELIPLNTLENIINSASGGDYESVLNQMSKEIDEFDEIESLQMPEHQGVPSTGVV